MDEGVVDVLAWRKRLGWSQREAARQLGVNLNTLQQYERGFRFDSDREVSVDRRTALAMMALEDHPESRLQ